MQVDQTRQHEAILQVDELRIGAIALGGLVAVLYRCDLAVGDDDGLLAQRLLSRVGEQPAGMDHDDRGLGSADNERGASHDESGSHQHLVPRRLQ